MKLLLATANKREGLYQPKFSFSFFEKLRHNLSLTLAQLAALTPRDYEIELISEGLNQRIDTTKNYDLVALSTITQHANRAYEVADEFRKRGIPVVLGGYHPSALPDEAKQHADAVVIGEGERIWPQLLHDFEQGNLKEFYRQKSLVAAKDIPFPRRDLIKGHRSAERVQATRGCPNQCSFCSIHNIEGYIYRKRPIEQVIKEIRSLKNTYFSFYDPSLTIDVSYTKELFKEMIPLKKRFDCHGNIDMLSYDEELVSLSKQAGCHAWSIGFESLEQNSINSVHKTNIVRNYEKGIQLIKNHGIAIKGLFMFGFDTDTANVFSATLKAVQSWNLDMAEFAILTPFPGTPLYHQLEDEGRIHTKNWDFYNLGNVVFEPKSMSKDDLFKGTRDVILQHNAWSSLYRRMLKNDHLNLSRLNLKLFGNITDRMKSQREQGFYQRLQHKAYQGEER